MVGPASTSALTPLIRPQVRVRPVPRPTPNSVCSHQPRVRPGCAEWDDVLTSAATSRSKPAITDTELQLGAFQIPDEPVDPDKDPSEYWTKGEEHVDPALRLPAWLKGEGRGGHHFISLQDQFVGIEGESLVMSRRTDS